MKKVDLVSWSMNGFKSFSEPADFEMPPPGLYFVRGQNLLRKGSNGAGKSTFVGDSLCWCWYGHTIRKLRNPDIANWTTDDPSYVGTAFTIDGAATDVTRSTKPNGLFISGKAVKPEAVVDLIGLDHPLFSNAVVLGQGRDLFFDLQPAEKMKLFNDVLHLERWEDRAWKAGAEVLELRRQAAGVEGERTATEGAIASLKQQIERLSGEHDEWEKNRMRELLAVQHELKQAQKAQAAANSNFNAADLAHDEAMTELRVLEDQWDGFSKACREVDARLARADLALQQNRSEFERLKAERDDLAKAKRCPTCGQPIKQDNVVEHRLELLHQMNELNKAYREGIDPAIKAAADEANRVIEQCEADLQAFRNKVRELEDTRSFAQTQAAEATARAGALARREEELKENANPYRNQLQTVRRQKSEAEVSLRDLKQEHGELIAASEAENFWIQGFRDIRLYIIEDLLSGLEETTNLIIEDMGLTGWKVRYTVENETKAGTVHRGMVVHIESPQSRRPVRWEAWSGGENQRLRLGGSLALSEVLLAQAGVEYNFEVLDEPSRSIDDVGIDDLIVYLAERAKRLRRTIFLVDHHAIASRHVSGIITIVHDENGSRIET